MKTTFCSYSFGCRVNQAEKEELDRQLSAVGFRYSVKNPVFYIINTCAVTQKAERETRQFIYQTRKKYPRTKIVVTGCAATKWIKEGVKIEGVDRLIDNVNKEFIANFITTVILNGAKNPFRITENVGDPSSPDFIGDTQDDTKDKFLSSGRLILKIQDGCQRFCTYCIVPYLRGQPKSERIKNLELRIRNHEDKIKEVILTAINTQAYGIDTGEKFIDLLKAIIDNTKVPRISMGSIHPWSINHEFFDFYKNYLPQQRLVNFFHIPLQSGSDKILNLMKRGYTREEFVQNLKRIEKINPFAFIGTDIIVGFLEETDRDFTDTYNFLKSSPISKFHIFRFSKRENTAAYFMAKRLKEPTPQIKAKRAKILSELSKIKYQKFLVSHIGKDFVALFLERRMEDHQEALLDNQVQATIKTDHNLTGEIRNVKIKGLRQGQLTGNLI